jgi:cell division protein FtsW
LILTIVLAGFGVVAIYSASWYVAKTQYGDSWYFVKKQLLGFILGLVALLFCARLDYRLLSRKKVRWIALILPMVLLVLVFVPGIGKTNYGATRWIGVGGFTIQPSELAKYGFVIFASAYNSGEADYLQYYQNLGSFQLIFPYCHNNLILLILLCFFVAVVFCPI